MTLAYTIMFRMGGGGWSERYYRVTAESPDAQTLPIDKFVRVRMELMTDAVFCDGVRISDVNVFRQAFLDSGGNRVAGLPVATHHRDQLTTAVLARLYGQILRHNRQLWLRGIPDEWVRFTDTGALDLDPEFNGKFNAWINVLNGQSTTIRGFPFAIRITDRTAGVNTFHEITAASVHVATGYTTLVIPGLGAGDGDTIQVRKMAFSGGFSPRGLNGRFKAFKAGNLVLPSDGYLIKFRLPAPDLIYLGGGQAATTIPAFETIKTGNMVKVSSHKTGRPFGQQAGRRRALAR